VSKQSDHRAYVLMDAAMAKQFAAWPNFISTAPGLAYAYLDDYLRGRPDIFRTGNTLEELATKAGMSAARLQATVAEINAQRSANRARPTLSTGPFYLLGPAQLYVTFTDGGLAIDDRHAVLDGNDRPIPGLFAAGSAGQGGLLLEVMATISAGPLRPEGMPDATRLTRQSRLQRPLRPNRASASQFQHQGKSGS
jgi:hypothetical protein